MFKKVLAIGIVVASLLVGCGQKDVAVKETTKAEQSQYDVFTYQVTDVNGNEVTGVPLDNVSPDNAGIFLDQNNFDIQFKKGDKIKVTYTKGIHDDIVSIEKVN